MTDAGLSGLKAELRRSILTRRDAMPADTRRALGGAIFATIAGLPAFRQARTILSYSSFGSEPDTGIFNQTARDQGKRLVLPRIDRPSRALELYRVDEPATQLLAGVWGIREPDPARCAPVTLPEIDVVLVPGVVFDIHGGRIGYGAGYYDRLLGRCADGPRLIAAAFELQIVEEVPMGPDDRRVDRVVTERCAYPA
ncbi:MAG: 5-formyltetrahydrofolate cyclo-ligase [Chloroflexi bacterium]|nr:5-formyltetrahydrofolate cyclo-ligase [Chloroflexota bacterium]